MQLIYASKIRYTEGYKYQLEDDFIIILPWLQGVEFDIDHVSLTKEGKLTIKKDWGWDGASGPTFDTKSTHRGSCFHDAGYYLIRKGLLDPAVKNNIDLTAMQIWIEDGMWSWRAKLWYKALKMFGRSSTLPENEKKIKTAP